MTEDRVLITVSAELVEKLERRARCSRIDLVDIDVMDSVVDQALAGDPSTWRQPVPEEFQVLSDVVFCACCRPGPCRRQFSWRNLVRCGCDNAGAFKSRIPE